MEPTSSNPGGAAADPLIGAIFGGKYQVREKVGAGGMGGVYRAEHLLMNRIVALKVLRSNLANDEVLLKRFHHEAKAASQISHPNAVTLFDYGVDNDVPYLVMEFIDGKTLKAIIAEEQRLPIPRVQEILRQICLALHEAHRAGIVHRDIKPDNFMVRKGEHGVDIVKVLDFGVSKSVGLTDFGGDSNLTQAGTIIGTPQYISPEQCQGLELDQRCDIYSLGAVVYEMITGEAPFRAPTVLELLVKVLHHDVEPIRKCKPELNIPPELDAVVMKSLAKDREKRFSTVTEFYEAFERAVPKPKVKQQNSSQFYLLGGGLLATVILVALVFGGMRQKSSDAPDESRAIESLEASVQQAEREKAEALDRVDRLRREADELMKRNEVEKAKQIQKEQDAAQRAELEKETALWQAQLARDKAEKALAEVKRKEQEKEVALRREHELSEKAEQEKQEALKQVEAAKAASERQAEEMKRAEEERVRIVAEQQEAAAKAEKERLELVRQQEEAAKKADEERAEALRQAEVAKAELAKLTEAAKQAEKEKVELLKKVEDAKKAQIKSPVTTAPQPPSAEEEAEKAKLAEAVRRANEQKAEAMRKVEQMKHEAEMQAAAARRAAAEADRIRSEAARRKQQAQQATPPPEATAQPTPENSEAPVKRRRCGPTWCL
jgi:serine/threonine protein kinase